MGSKTKMQSNFIFCVALHYWKSKSRFENHFCVWLISRLFTPLPCIIHLLDEGVVFLPECHLAPVLSVVWCRTAVSLSCRYWELELHPALCWQDTQPARSVPVIFIIYYLLSGCHWSQVSFSANQTYQHIWINYFLLQIVCWKIELRWFGQV